MLVVVLFVIVNSNRAMDGPVYEYSLYKFTHWTQDPAGFTIRITNKHVHYYTMTMFMINHSPKTKVCFGSGEKWTFA